MNEFEKILIRITYALQSLNQTHQRELANFIEHYASEYETPYETLSGQPKMEAKNAKETIDAGNYF